MTDRSSCGSPARLAAAYVSPVTYPYRDYVDPGGLMTYLPGLG